MAPTVPKKSTRTAALARPTLPASSRDGRSASMMERSLLPALWRPSWLARHAGNAPRAVRGRSRPPMVRRYIRDAELFDDNAAARIGL